MGVAGFLDGVCGSPVNVVIAQCGQGSKRQIAVNEGLQPQVKFRGAADFTKKDNRFKGRGKRAAVLRMPFTFIAVDGLRTWSNPASP